MTKKTALTVLAALASISLLFSGCAKKSDTPATGSAAPSNAPAAKRMGGSGAGTAAPTLDPPR